METKKVLIISVMVIIFAVILAAAVFNVASQMKPIDEKLHENFNSQGFECIEKVYEGPVTRMTYSNGEYVVGCDIYNNTLPGFTTVLAKTDEINGITGEKFTFYDQYRGYIVNGFDYEAEDHVYVRIEVPAEGAHYSVSPFVVV